jgi:hypothetical protein
LDESFANFVHRYPAITIVWLLFRRELTDATAAPVLRDAPDHQQADLR